MGLSKITYSGGDTLSAGQMNDIQDAIIDNALAVSSLEQATDELKSATTIITGAEQIGGFVSGYIDTSGNTIDVSSVSPNTTYVHAVVDCAPGDVFYIMGRGGGSALPYAVINGNDSNKKTLYSDSTNISERMIVMPPNSTKAVFNFNKNYDYHVYRGAKVPDQYTELSQKIADICSIIGRDLIAATNYCSAYNTSGSTVDLSSIRYNYTFYSAAVDVSEGDAFTITANGDTTSKPWTFIGSNGAVLTQSSGVSCNNETIVAPENAVKLIINYKPSYDHLIYTGVSIQSVLDDYKNLFSVNAQKFGDVNTKDDPITLTIEAGTFTATKDTQIGTLPNANWNRAYCAVQPNTGYHITTYKYTNTTILYAFTDANDIVVEVGNDTIENGGMLDKHITAPQNASKLWIKCYNIYSPYAGEVIGYEALQDQISAGKDSPFYASYECVEIPNDIGETGHGRLSLIATKKDNYWSKTQQNDVIENPSDVGYLYLDESTEKLYYSVGVYNRPEYLFTWNATIANSAPCKNYVPIITPDGDIIFLTQGKVGRRNPIIYPAGDYNNPSVIQIDAATLPGGLTTDTGACVYTRGDFILWGEYQANNETGYNGQPMRIWKVTKPYSNPANWRVVLTKYYSASGNQWGEDPENEITHFHTVALDQYTGYFYANTGDADNECRVFESRDQGETWTELVSGSQKWRTLGYIFTSDGCYWATDSYFPNHNIYKVSRDGNGVLDFTTCTRIAVMMYALGSSQHQRAYNTCLTRNPDGLLILDRAEERTDNIYELQFYSFEYNKLFLLDTLHSSEGNDTRYGFGNLACTYYQPTQENGIVCGGNSYDRDMSLAILNNNPSNRLGNTKIVIHRNAPRI